jgi:hypothetical protein
MKFFGWPIKRWDGSLNYDEFQGIRAMDLEDAIKKMLASEREEHEKTHHDINHGTSWIERSVKEKLGEQTPESIDKTMVEREKFLRETTPVVLELPDSN